MADYFIEVKVTRLSPATGDCSIIGLATDPDFSPTAVFDLCNSHHPTTNNTRH